MRAFACLGLGLAAVLLVDVPRAEACGCLSPPAPSEVTGADYAVNQRAEQIIFEVEPNWVTAHVLIKYAGAPESFAWIVPVPEAPTEMSISPVSAFGLIDRATAPQINVSSEDICPRSEWSCRYHPSLSCGDDGNGGNAAPGFADAGAGSGSDPSDMPPVTVIDEQVVGDYQTVTFRADEAGAATTWLRDNGFIVNQTTAIYMEPYVQAGMVFVAAKLVAGAGVDAIKPLRMKYRAAYPMVPLVLTAVAAEPHLTVTSFIYSDSAYLPMNHPVVTIDPERIARDNQGRVNYPMVLARTVDEAGGDGFVAEYQGFAPRTTFETSPCCSAGFDLCGIGGNTQCECPNADFEQNDCSAIGDLLEGVELVDALATKYQRMSRWTTRVSAEEMTFDPTFQVDYGYPSQRLQINVRQPTLTACEDAVLEPTLYNQLQAQQDCSTLYCGPGGRCVTTAAGPGCACDDDTVAQRFFDLDQQASVTCVPTTPPVDLRAGGDILPDACAGISCGIGECVDRNGVAVCDCAPGTAAIAGTNTGAPRCAPVVLGGTTPGAQDFSEALRDLDVCAPAPPTCGEGGWLEHRPVTNPGVACPGVETTPSVAAQTPPPAPQCEGWFDGCGGCATGSDDPPYAALGGAWLLAALLLRRRRA